MRLVKEKVKKESTSTKNDSQGDVLGDPTCERKSKRESTRKKINFENSNSTQIETKNENAMGEATFGGALRAPSQVPPLAFLFSFSF